MRVFVLGAGVSSTYGCPVTKDLLRDAIEFSSRQQMIQKIKDVLRYTYPEFVEKDKNYPNVEDFLSLLEMWKDFNSKVQRKPAYSDFEIEQIRRYVIRILVELLDKCLVNIGKDHSIMKFANCLTPNDIIITVNWDLGLEFALDKMYPRIDWRYRLPRRPTRRDVVLLKAHGSIDWFNTEDITFLSRKRWFFLDEALGNISVLDSWDYPKYKGREELIPFIVPPTLSKIVQQGEIMGIWADIYRALQRAEQIFVFGYSLPQADLHARFTLRAAIQNNPFHQKASHEGIVKIFNPDSEVRQTFTEILGKKFVFRQCRFQDVNFDMEMT